MKDEKIEEKFRKFGLEFSYLDSIKLSEIDIEKSLHNQARIAEPINKDRLQIFITLLPHNEFPPIIVIKNSNKYNVGDGNHRVVGARDLNWTEYPYGAYVIKGTDIQIEKFINLANADHGLPIDLEERIAKAVYMVTKYGMTEKDAALLFGAPEHRVSGRVVAQRVTERANELGIENIDILSNTAKQALFRLKPATLFIKTTNVAIERKMPFVDLQNLTRKIENAPSEEVALRIIEDEKDTAKKIKANTLSNKTKAIPMFRKIERIHRAANNTFIPNNMRLLSGKLVKKAYEKLDEIIDLIEICKAAR